MPTLQTSLAFFGAALLLALAPGPDIIFVVTQSASEGRRTGFAVVAGLITGVMGHTLAVALGLAALLAASSVAFMALKWFGAAYLLYLAWGHGMHRRSARPRWPMTPRQRNHRHNRGYA